ncbi:MAG: GNAT family N-acetyltransferase [Methanolinea sp.]|jgi:RimJ/RimL family protein N-acetyltransferase|nr:GNAT family N-acetyltransferase [Methanolinea sp.]
MAIPETLITPRLILRQFTMDDAPVVQALAGDVCIAAGVLSIPHPYTLDDAWQWIGQHPSLRQSGEQFIFAVTELRSRVLAGAVSIRVNEEHAHAELGYWIGRPFQGRGYATEAAGAMLEFGFLGLHLHRIYARHLAWNTPSSRVLSHIGMSFEGTMQGHACKWGVFHDVHLYGIQAGDFYMNSLETNNSRLGKPHGDR